jgi:hypothetical protein
MSYFSKASTPFLRSVAVTALIGTAMLISPLSTARADEPAHAPRHQTAEMKAETVEQRIASLHAALQITPDEETNWGAVAQTMRENAGKMEKLSAEKTETPPGSMTALEDLKTYEKFAHAHFEGLKNLISSFETLYAAMPDAQKKIADHVFQSFGREHGPSHA